jgi:hypothetical protein
MQRSADLIRSYGIKLRGHLSGCLRFDRDDGGSRRWGSHCGRRRDVLVWLLMAKGRRWVKKENGFRIIISETRGACVITII